jgi:hypothetical protein
MMGKVVDIKTKQEAMDLQAFMEENPDAVVTIIIEVGEHEYTLATNGNHLKDLHRILYTAWHDVMMGAWV